jgi:hypothetical protein
MKKFVTGLFFLITITVFCQTAFKEDNISFNVGYGQPNLYSMHIHRKIGRNPYHGHSKDVTYHASGLGPIFFNFEYGPSKKWDLE